MIDIIHEASKDPLGEMMLDYYNGMRDVYVEVESPTFDMLTMQGKTMFRNYSEMEKLEQCALHLCDGKILDVGAGSGSHSIYLQQNGYEVDALDISPGCVQVMTKRNVKNVFHKNLFSMEGRKYKSILMLMNGLGICGTLDGCNLFLQFVKTILVDGGQVIADSTDIGLLYRSLDEYDYDSSDYYGETEFIMKYKTIKTDPFNWIYIDFKTLEALALFNGLQCTQIASDQRGRYLTRIF